MASIHYHTGKARRKARDHGHNLGRWNRYMIAWSTRLPLVERDAICTNGDCGAVAWAQTSDIGGLHGGNATYTDCTGDR